MQQGLVFLLVFPELGRLDIQGAGHIGLSKQRLQTQQDSSYIIRGSPLLLQDIQADIAMVIDVGVETGSRESDVGRSVGIVAGKVQLELVGEALVDGPDWTVDGADPVEDVFVAGEGGDPLVAGRHEFHQLLLESLFDGVGASLMLGGVR